jgi:AAA domain, putative AbiEii toxin, Type IV TA system/AAA ATPase domain
MRLTKVTVTNYRCITDSGPVEIGDVTCLVGKNESGKTAFLQALRRLNPVDGPSAYEDVMDYPAGSFALYKKVRDKRPAEVVTAVFELEDAEVARIEKDFGASVLGERAFTVTKRYPNGRMTYDVRVDEPIAVRHLTKNLVLPQGRGKTIRQLKSIARLVEALDAIETPDSSVTTLRQRIASWRKERLTLKLIDDYLDKWLPRFFYFDNYSVLEGKVSIPELRRRRDAGELQDADRTMLALLSMVGARLEDFQDASHYERLKRELEAAANGITDQVFQYWTQNKQLAVDLDIANPEAGAQPPLDQGPILHIRIHNQRHRVTVPFDERSRGFVWFFSFLAYFSELEDAGDGRDILLLLDEPGLNLHATAQRDLLRFIDERLAPRHQTIYSTHSPFMIQADRLDRSSP